MPNKCAYCGSALKTIMVVSFQGRQFCGTNHAKLYKQYVATYRKRETATFRCTHEHLPSSFNWNAIANVAME